MKNNIKCNLQFLNKTSRIRGFRIIKNVANQSQILVYIIMKSIFETIYCRLLTHNRSVQCLFESMEVSKISKVNHDFPKFLPIPIY